MKYIIYFLILLFCLKLKRDYQRLQNINQTLKQWEKEHQEALARLDWDYGNGKIDEDAYQIQRNQLQHQHQARINHYLQTKKKVP